MALFEFSDLIKLTIFLNLFILDKKLKIYPEYVHPFHLPYKKPILLNDKTQNSTLLNGRNFLDICLNFHNYKKYKLLSPPKATVVIPLYNCEKTISAALHSVQYQNFSEIEIILVNDFSTDNTSEIIKYYQKNDHRIKILNNFKNMGTLYSRSIAVLVSKGEYIFNLDNDDLYFDKDILDYIYKRGKNESLDIISFQAIKNWNYTADVISMLNIFTYQYPEELYVKQPELGIWMINHKGKFVVHNNMIWDKCIRSSIYIKAVNLMSFNRYSKFLSWAEDTSINFVIFNIANNFKHLKKYGIYHFMGSNTASCIQPINSKIFGEIFFLDILFDFSRNITYDKNLIIGQAIYIYKIYQYYNIINDTNNYFYLKAVLNKIIKCKYLSKLNKRKIRKLFIYFYIF